MESFTEITLQVIQEDGLDGYLPTLMIPALKQIQAIEGIPESVDHRDAIQESVLKNRLDKQEFLFGVQSGPHEITTGHYRPSEICFMTIVESKAGLVVTRLAKCKWWRVGTQQGVMPHE